MNRSDFKAFKAIENIMQTYVTGITACGEKGVEICKKVFHEKALMCGWDLDGHVEEGGIQVLYDSLIIVPPVSDKKSHMDILDVFNDTAVVRIEIEKIWPNENIYYTEFHLLMKFEEEWKIVAVFFVQHITEWVHQPSFKDYYKIKKTLSIYCDDNAYSDEKTTDIIKKVFFEDGKIWGFYDDKCIVNERVEEFYKSSHELDPAIDKNFVVDILDVADSVACTCVNLEKTWPDRRLNTREYHCMMKKDSEWKCMCRLFAQH